MSTEDAMFRDMQEYNRERDERDNERADRKHRDAAMDEKYWAFEVGPSFTGKCSVSKQTFEAIYRLGAASVSRKEVVEAIRSRLFGTANLQTGAIAVSREGVASLIAVPVVRRDSIEWVLNAVIADLEENQ